MEDIKCPHCQKMFKIDEAGFADIVKQVRDHQFQDELENRLALAEKEKENPFILRLKNQDEQLYADMVKYGRRNIALLTIAPTGTTSLMTQTTSGIEPVFLASYTRRRKINPQEKDVKIDF